MKTTQKYNNTITRILTALLLVSLATFVHAAQAVDDGYIKLPDGSLYKGDLKYNVIRDGNGHNKWDNGREYIGQWFNDQPHGKGKLILPESDYYKGEFVYGSYHGFGQLKEKDTLFTGQFQNGEQSGIGLLESVNNEYFLGEFYKTQKHGRILFFATATSKPVLQIWVKDELERNVKPDNPTDKQLYDQFVDQIMTMAREYQAIKIKRVRMSRQGGVRRQLEEVENPIEYIFGQKVIQLLKLYNE